MSHHGYIVISPARDEEEHVERAIGSLLTQWSIVSDGSVNGTTEILDLATREFIA